MKVNILKVIGELAVVFALVFSACFVFFTAMFSAIATVFWLFGVGLK